jgi:diguanylate cyclase (GGDEF)-like protein/PAS domain S-box-containing protein
MPPIRALNIRIKLLVPFIIALVLVFLSAQYILYSFQREQQQQQLNKTSQHLHQQLTHQLQQDSEHFQHSIALMLRPQGTQQAWKQQNTAALREHCLPFYRQLAATLQLQQMDFYTPDGEKFLGFTEQNTAAARTPTDQTAQPATLRAAIATRQPASGTEIDASGQLLQLVVIPWQVDGELLGYLQLGKPLDHTIRKLTRLHQTPIIISSEADLDKPASVLIQTLEQTPAELLRLINKGESYKNHIISVNQQRHLLSGFTIQDPQQNNIARLSFLYNIEQQLQSREQILFSMLIISILTGLAVSLFYFIYSGRVAQTLRANYQKLKHEVSEHKQTEQELIQNKDVLEQLVIERNKSLTESKRRYQTLFDKSADALILLNDDGFVDCNQATLDMFGYKEKSELYQLHPSSISPEFQPDGERSSVKADLMVQKALHDGSHCFEWQHRRKNGETFPAEVILTVIPSREEQLVHAVVRDISDRKKAEEEIRFRAYYDSLTRLPNRQLLLDRLEQAIMTSQRSEDFNAILFIDLDRFKSINDSLGHNTGDLLLIDTAARIKHCIREIDTAARFGGDEYVVLLKHLGDEQDEASFNAKRIAQNINQAFQQPFILNHQEIHITCSIGITIFPIADDSVEDIIKHADTAMYSAKESGRNRIAFYLSEMHETVLKRLSLEKDLRLAVKNKQLSVHYQPQLDQQNQVIGVEALARWKHPEHGFVNPETFIEIAEETGLINELGQFILEQAISDMLYLQQDNCMPPQLSVNISPHQFRHNEFIGMIKSALGLHQLEPHFLTLEVTESVIINNLNETIGKFEELRQLDIRMSLDDFGTGYSSLSHLKRLPLDELKIDKSFVFDLLKDPHDALLVQTIINIASEFGLDTVAEGVEDDDQLAFLQSKGCKYYQGYYFSRPLPLAQLKVFMQKKTDLHKD